MHSPGNILICYQARGSAGFLDLQRFVKLIYMFSGKTLNIYILSRRLITEESLNLEMKNKYVKLYNINMLKAMRIKANASILFLLSNAQPLPSSNGLSKKLGRLANAVHASI